MYDLNTVIIWYKCFSSFGGGWEIFSFLFSQYSICFVFWNWNKTTDQFICEKSTKTKWLNWFCIVNSTDRMENLIQMNKKKNVHHTHVRIWWLGHNYEWKKNVHMTNGLTIETKQQKKKWSKTHIRNRIIQQQGELVDSVEHHVESSTDYIKQGHLELIQAEKYQSKARKVFFFLLFPSLIFELKLLEPSTLFPSLSLQTN